MQLLFSFILAGEGYAVTHTPTHTAWRVTLISGLSFPSLIYFLLLFQLSSSSFLPPHPLIQPPTAVLSSVVQYFSEMSTSLRDPLASLVPPETTDATWLRNHSQPLLSPAEVQTLPTRKLFFLLWKLQSRIPKIKFSELCPKKSLPQMRNFAKLQ